MMKSSSKTTYYNQKILNTASLEIIAQSPTQTMLIFR